MGQSRSWLIFLGIFAGAVGAATVFWLTQTGIGLWFDTYYYFMGADNLTAGIGFYRSIAYDNYEPITHFPPMYSCILAIISFTGFPLTSAARWLNIAAMGGTSALMTLLVYRGSGKPLLALLSCAILAWSETMITTHVWALSEPLFFIILMAGTWVLFSGKERPNDSWSSVIAGGLLFGLLPLTRYLGISIAGAALIVMGIRCLQSTSQRRWQFAVFSLLTVAPITFWFLRNLLLTGNPADTPPIILHPPDHDAWLFGADTFLSIFLPDLIREKIPVAVMLLLGGSGAALSILALVATVWRSVRRQPKTPEHYNLRLFLSLAFLGYCTQLLYSVFFIVRITPFDLRILSPLFLTMSILLFLGIGRFSDADKNLKGALYLALMLFLTFECIRANNLIRAYTADPPGFTSNAWQTSPTLAYVHSISDDPLYTNEVEAIYLLTGRIARFIPTPLNPAADAPRADYEDWLASMRTAMRVEHARLVLFLQTEEKRQAILNLEELTSGLEIEASFLDGEIYRMPASR
ncbi:MAG: hypothetical protein JXA97_03345 [Anaerolineales bacterium]|nr:hypothetical protein [Anaerolineales bacterium]